MLVGIAISIPVVLLFFYFLRTLQDLWWLPVGVALFLFSVILARLAPILIMPLFYRFRPLEDGQLKEHIVNLCRNVGMRVGGTFTFNMSKNTKKANAGFTGIGRSKRVILRGEVPSPINPPAGCRFHPRCNYAMDMCRKYEPALEEVKKDHFVACFLHHKTKAKTAAREE